MSDFAERIAFELNGVLDVVSDGIVVLDIDGVVIRWNKAMEGMTGYLRDEVVGLSCGILRSEPVALNVDYRHVLNLEHAQGDISDITRTFIRRKEGASVPVFVCVREISSETNIKYGTVISFTLAPNTENTSAKSPKNIHVSTRKRGSISRTQLIEILTQCDWNKAEAARRLGLDRTSIWRRMRKLGIPMSPITELSQHTKVDEEDTEEKLDLSWD